MNRRTALLTICAALPLIASAVEGDPAAPVRAFCAGVNGRSATQIAILVGETFDLDVLAASALGAAPATRAQRSRLGKVMARRIAAEIVQRGASAQTVVVKTKVLAPGQWLVTTQTARRNMDPMLLTWRVNDTPGGTRIVDVLRDGTSSIGVQRREIATALRRQSLDAVIAAMEQRYGG